MSCSVVRAQWIGIKRPEEGERWQSSLWSALYYYNNRSSTSFCVILRLDSQIRIRSWRLIHTQRGKMSDNGGNSSREKTTQWLQHVLQTYYTYLNRQNRKHGSAPPPSSGETTNNELVAVNVIDFDIGPGFSGDGRISTLSDLLSLRVQFTVSVKYCLGLW